jgi:hypothetical protein
MATWKQVLLDGDSGTTINNNADNRVITGSGTANTLNGEANVTYDATNLAVASGGIQVDNNQSFFAKNTSGTARILAKADGSNVAVFNGGFTQTLIGGASGITLSGPVTAESIIQQHDNVSSEGDFGAGADITFLGSSGSSTILGRVYYYDGSTWQAFSSATEAAQKALLGIALGTTMASGFLLKGFIHPSSATLTTAAPVFGATNASFQSAAPSSGFQRVLGHAISTSAIYFNPSQEYIELS